MPPTRVVTVGSLSLSLWRHLTDFTTLVGQLVLDLGQVLRAPREMPWRESSANLYKSGVRAMPVTALVGFLIGIVLSYLSALQLKNFGADIFIVNILGMGIIRELGPVLVIYPEAIWYTYVDKEDIDEIIDQHLLHGRVVERLKV